MVPSDDTADIVEMLQAEMAEEHAQENAEQDLTMPDCKCKGIILGENVFHFNYIFKQN